LHRASEYCNWLIYFAAIVSIERTMFRYFIDVTLLNSCVACFIDVWIFRRLIHCKNCAKLLIFTFEKKTVFAAVFCSSVKWPSLPWGLGTYKGLIYFVIIWLYWNYSSYMEFVLLKYQLYNCELSPLREQCSDKFHWCVICLTHVFTCLIDVQMFHSLIDL